MTLPIDGQKKPVFTGAIGAKAEYKALGVDKMVIFGPTAEGKVQYKGWHAGAGVTAGTGLSVDAEIGKTFNLNKNWDIDLSLNANHSISFGGKSKVNLEHIDFNTGETINQISAEWKPGVTTAGVKAMAYRTSNNGKITFGAGVSGQYCTNNAKNVSLTTTVTDENSTTTYYHAENNHKNGFVVSPELKVSLNVNKNCSIEGKGNIFGGGISAKYTF